MVGQAGGVGEPSGAEEGRKSAWTVPGMPRSDLTAQRSVMLIDDLDDACMDIADVQRDIGFLDEYIILRIQTTALEALFVGCRKRFILCHS